MYESLARTTRDPFEEIPRVRSFLELNTVLVSWDDDEASDEYYLYRAEDSISPQYQLIYRGPGREYRDVFSLSDTGKKYLYRLGKRRGDRYFRDLLTPGKAALGVPEDDTIDKYEPNDTLGRAVPLGTITVIANSYYYLSNTADNISFHDEDWYWVDIPGHWTCQIVLNDVELMGGSTVRRFRLGLQNGPVEEITSNTEFAIYNPEDDAGRFYFRIFPAWDVFKSYSPSLSGGCGAFVPYEIKVKAQFPGT
jgi:hypothetical protein